ncbi:hypothetical protein CALVIDRAFT_415782 [Calocera viscosa TUFC12733]|uniref:Uncharacterized protein n=1 Tax=Calocera viscosa (strain TUFC12733) TaxID=1330018 RepID=A0A167G0F8_CALVF|nr:hypothetical protein CALVIDRAFT_415782 [Calocera viscosa TUFC12733]
MPDRLGRDVLVAEEGTRDGMAGQARERGVLVIFTSIKTNRTVMPTLARWSRKKALRPEDETSFRLARSNPSDRPTHHNIASPLVTFRETTSAPARIISQLGTHSQHHFCRPAHHMRALSPLLEHVLLRPIHLLTRTVALAAEDQVCMIDFSLKIHQTRAGNELGPLVDEVRRL